MAVSKHSEKRLSMCIFTLTALLVVLVARLYIVQIARHDFFKKKALEQQEDVVTLEPARGMICDRNGQKLTVNREVDSLFANPREIEKAYDVAKIAAPVLGMPFQELLKKISNRSRYFVWVKRKLDDEESKKLKALDIKGFYFIKEPKRFYPEGELAAHLVGFVGVDNEGLDGIENACDKYLRGTAVKAIIQKDGTGKNVCLKSLGPDFEQEGNEITLTIDNVIQHIAQRELKEAFLKYRAKNAVIIVMDPKTGEILALANEPAFDPNEYRKYSVSSRRNRAIADTFEPGSTFKIITASAALEESIVGLNDKFNCEGGTYKFKVGREYRTIRDVHKYKNLSFLEVMRYSSNIGMTKLGMKMGEDKLYKYIKAFGFGESTQMGMPGEAKGLSRPVEKWSAVSIAAIPYGQEISVTPLQITTAIACVANNGMLMKPQIIKSIKEYGGKTIYSFSPVEVRQVISPKTAAVVTRMLKDVVDNGTGNEAIIPGYSIVGKTGTSQKINPLTRKYDPNNFVSSFVGYFPAENPKFVIYVLVDEPRGEYYGGPVAGPVFRDVAKGIIDYMNVSRQDGKLQPEFAQKEQDIPKNAVGSAQSSGQEWMDTPEGIMPDLKGKTMRFALNALKKQQVKIVVQGSGVVTSQFPRAGAVLKPSQDVKIVCGAYSAK